MISGKIDEGRFELRRRESLIGRKMRTKGRSRVLLTLQVLRWFPYFDVLVYEEKVKFSPGGIGKCPTEG